jgi:DnaJ like chaperone protein
MSWLGKLLGAFFGFLAAGPIGAVFGIVVGHYFDLARAGHIFIGSPQGHTQTQDIFFRATFSILGHIAKADGRVSENEIRAASRIMQNMMLTHELKRQAIHYFRMGKDESFDLDHMLSALYAACYQQPNLLHLFLEIQLQGALADGVVNPNKQRILEHISLRLGLNTQDFFFRQAYQQQQQRRGYQQSYQPPPRTDHLENAYRLLGVSRSSNNLEVKKAYRKLMSQNHPDKLVSKGLPEEMIKLATQKTQEIKAAYELICKSRGI